MQLTIETDQTGETAKSLATARNLLMSGRFYLLALSGTMAQTDLASLHRIMDEVVTKASLCHLCDKPDAMTPQERAEMAQAAASELKGLLSELKTKALEWFKAQPAEIQMAVLTLVVSLRMWAESKVPELSPEGQEVVNAIKDLLTLLTGDMAGVRVGITMLPVNGQA